MSNTVLGNIDIDMKKLIVDAMENATDLYKFFKQQSPFTTTHNCYPSARWDAINEALSNNLLKENLPFATTKKGFWDLLLFCNRENTIIFSAMRKDRFSYVCDNPEKNAPQYFDSLVTLNKNLKAIASQVTFEGSYEASDKYNQLEILCNKLPLQKNSSITHVVVVFDVYYDEITSINLYVVNSKFEIVETEDIFDTVLQSQKPNIVPEAVFDNEESSTSKQKGFVKLKNTINAANNA